MTKSLGGATFIHNGIEFDYHFVETVRNLQAFCDQVVIVDAGSDDGTTEIVRKLEDYKTKVVCLGKDEWDAQQGREKLAYFQNVAKSYLETEYYVVIQGDELMHESSFRTVRDCINTGHKAFMCYRANLWFNPWLELSVPLDRMPCSREVIRIARTEFNSVGDGENIDCAPVCFDFVDKINIIHYGFVRDRAKMKVKVGHMLENVFGLPRDPKLDQDDVFNPHAYFDMERDVRPMTLPTSRFIEKWVTERHGVRPS